jgi:hypothetical protein
VSATNHSGKVTRVDVSWAPWCALCVALAVTVFTTVADSDLWGNIKFGLDMLSTGHLTATDPYSFTQDRPWVNHEWLSEACMAVAYRVGGAPALIMLKAALVLSAYAIVASAYGTSAPLASGVALVLLTWSARPMTLSVRPQLWTLLCLAILCRLFMLAPRRGWLVFVPALFLLWVNFHGGWLVGFAVLGVWASWRFVQNSAEFPRSWAMTIVALTAVATLVNPYGWRIWAFLWETVNLTRDASEWQPIWATPGISWWPAAVVAATATACFVSRRRPSVDRIGIVLILAYGAIRVRRVAPLFAAGTLILIAPTIVAFVAAWPERFRTFMAPSRSAAWLAFVPVVWLAFVATRQVTQVSRCIPIQGDWVPDPAAAVALKRAAMPGRLINPFGWGHFALWHLSPTLKISIDGRRETVYSDRVLQ